MIFWHIRGLCTLKKSCKFHSLKCPSHYKQSTYLSYKNSSFWIWGAKWCHLGTNIWVNRFKMVPHMAATVLSSSVCTVFVSFSCFCFSNTISFTRDELLSIWQSTPHNLLQISIIQTRRFAVHCSWRGCGKENFSNSAALCFLAEWHHTRQCVTSSELSGVQSRLRRGINGEIVRWRDVLLHQWEGVYRCNCVKEDVLSWSGNALH